MVIKSQTLNPSIFTQVFKGKEHQPFALAGGQPAALLVHGFPGTPAEMLPLAQVLNHAGWTVKGLLLPGFGPQIDTLFKRSYSEWVEAIRAELLTLKQKHNPLLLGGFSMGGALSINVAATESVDGLLLMAPFWKMSGPFWGLLPIFRRFFPVIHPYRLMHIDYSNPEVRKGMIKLMPKVDLDDPAVQAGIHNLPVPTSIIEEIRQLGRRTWQLTPQVKTKTLILQGSQDKIVKPHHTRQLVNRIQANKQYYEVNTGHDIPDSTNPAWSEVVREILLFSQELANLKG